MKRRNGILALLGSLFAHDAWGLGAILTKFIAVAVAIAVVTNGQVTVREVLTAIVVQVAPAAAPPEPLNAEDGILDGEAAHADGAAALVESLPGIAVGATDSADYRAAIDAMVAQLKTAIETAADKKRAEITAVLAAVAQQLSAQAARLDAVAASVSAAAQPFLVVGPQIKSRGETVRSFGRSCFYYRQRDNAPVTIDLGPGIVGLGTAAENTGVQLRAAGAATSATANALRSVINSLGYISFLIQEGGQETAVFKVHFTNMLDALIQAGQSEIDIGNRIVAIGVEEERAGNSYHAMARQFGEYADCRMSNYLVVGPFALGDVRRARDARYRGIERRLAVKGDGNFSAATGLKGAGGALVDLGVQHVTRLQLVRNLTLDINRLIAFANNFSGCPAWFGKQPTGTRSPVESDTHAKYNIFTAKHPASGQIALRVDGTLGNVPYVSYASYSTATTAIYSFAANQEIRPTVPGGKDYSVYFLPKNSPFMNKRPETTLELPPDANFTLANRVYNDKGVPAMPMPMTWAVSPSNLSTPVMCPGRPTMDSEYALTNELPPQSPVIRFYRQLSSRIFFPDGLPTGVCSAGYLLAQPSPDTVDVLEFNRKPQANQVAYLSIGAVGSTFNPHTTVINGVTLRGNISGDEMIERNGRVTIAFIPDWLPPLEKRLAIEAALQAGHVNLVTKPKDAHYIYRVKVPTDFPGNPSKVPCNPNGLPSVTLADAAIGDYYPVGQSYPVEDFIAGASLMSVNALQAERFIWNLYRALLGRSPALSELRAWLAAPPGANWYVTVLRGVQYSLEAKLRLVNEMVTNLQVPNEGASLGYAADYWAVAEYYANKSPLACEPLVQALYKTFLRRPEVPYGMWYSFCENPYDGISRAQVIQGIVRSREAQNILVNYYYQTYLGRTEPVGSGPFETYVSFIQQGFAHHDIGYYFGLSGEFLNRPPAK